MNNHEMGRYVICEPHPDGSIRYCFYVPPRLRPAAWPPRIELPQMGNRVGKPTDRAFRQRVITEAAKLNLQLDQRRSAGKLTSQLTDHSIKSVAEIYFRSTRFKELSNSRKVTNKHYVKYLIQWSEARGHPDVADISAVDIEDLLSFYDDRPTVRHQVRSSMSMLMQQARAAKWRTDNPMAEIKWSQPDPTLLPLWTMDDIEQYSAAALEIDEVGLAALLHVQIRIGQRLGDVRQILHWDESSASDVDRPLFYKEGAFHVRQGKTKQFVQVPIPARMRDWIKRAQIEGSRYVFNDVRFKTFFTESLLDSRIRQIRTRVIEQGGKYLIPKRLRHSAIVYMLKAGASVIEVANVSGHKYNTVYMIMERYAIRQDDFALKAMKIVNRHHGGQDSDFDLSEDDLRTPVAVVRDEPSRRRLRGRPTKRADNVIPMGLALASR